MGTNKLELATVDLSTGCFEEVVLVLVLVLLLDPKLEPEPEPEPEERVNNPSSVFFLSPFS